MNSKIKKKTQEAVDGVFGLVDGCEIVMLIDRDTGLVLSTNGGATMPQNERDGLASRARRALAFAPASTLSDEGGAGDTITATCIEASGRMVVIRDLSADGVALVGRFDRAPNRADLSQAAADVLGLFATTEEAA